MPSFIVSPSESSRTARSPCLRTAVLSAGHAAATASRVRVSLNRSGSDGGFGLFRVGWSRVAGFRLLVVGCGVRAPLGSACPGRRVCAVGCGRFPGTRRARWTAPAVSPTPGAVQFFVCWWYSSCIHLTGGGGSWRRSLAWGRCGGCPSGRGQRRGGSACVVWVWLSVAEPRRTAPGACENPTD
jgi:hypothetical protein